MGNTPDIVISIQQLTGGGHEEICDKNVGHGTEMVGNHWPRLSLKPRLLRFQRRPAGGTFMGGTKFRVSLHS